MDRDGDGGGSPSLDHSGSLEAPNSPSLAPTSPAPSARSHSIRRKPPPSNDGHTDARRSQVSESRSSGEYDDRDRASVDDVHGGRDGVLFDRGAVPGPSVHSFPPQPHAASTRAPYTSTNPRIMSAAATGAAGHEDESPTRSNANSLHDATTELNAQGPAYPTRLANRTSIHSQRSSVAPEGVFGTAPAGVIGRHKPREIVRIERDYSGGELCQFWSGWIWELEGRVSPTEYQNTLNELNTVLASAHNPYKSLLDNTLAILTLYLSPYVLGSHYEREMTKFDKILERANRDTYNPAGLNILSPRRTAFLFIEIEYY